jgi:hypothetical protein
VVWNLWETVPAFWTDERKMQFPRGLPNDHEPPAAGVPAGWKLVPFRQAYPDRPTWEVRVIGEIAEFGHLDDRGEFIPDYGLPIVSRSGLKGLIRSEPGGSPRYYTLPRPSWDTWPEREGPNRDAPEEVYEYRSGRLIKGTLQGSGNFVPELGSKVLDFKEYDPLTDRRRIYNLPGVLRKAQ